MISANELETFLNNCQFYFSKWWPCNFQSCHDHPLEKNCQIKVASKCKFLSMYYLPYLGYQNSTTYFPRVNFHKKREQKKCDFFSPSLSSFIWWKKEPNRKNVLLEFSIKEHQTNLLPLFSLQSSPYDTYHATLR